jgi:glutathione synthase
MKIGFVVNNVNSEKAAFTTTRLARTATHMGHVSYMLGVGDFVYAPDGSIHAHARRVQGSNYETLEDYITELQSDATESERILIDELDVLLLRNNPAEDSADRPWAQTSGILFGQLAAARGVIVLNDPTRLANAINKTYFQQFPEQVRPRTCISRDPKDIKSFITDQREKVIIKPLQGSGGQSVFLINEDERANLNQMIEAVIRDGYCIAQEYLPAAAEGDVRLFVMNGRPLWHAGRYAAFRRVNGTGDARSNMHSGGHSEEVEVSDQMLALVEMVRPKLVRDGMFLVGLDIVEDKLMEINVFSPGGLGSSEHHTGVDFTNGGIFGQDLKELFDRTAAIGKCNFSSIWHSQSTFGHQPQFSIDRFRVIVRSVGTTDDIAPVAVRLANDLPSSDSGPGKGDRHRSSPVIASLPFVESRRTSHFRNKADKCFVEQSAVVHILQ